MSRRTLIADGGALGLLAAAVIAMFWPAALMHGTFFVQDMMVQNYPFRYLSGLALRAGELPLWRPEINCGFPLLAEGQVGVFYPLNFLAYLLLPTGVGLNLNIMFHIWLAGAGTFALLRCLGAGRAAGLAAGLAFALSGFLVVRAMSPNFIDVCAWLPVLFLCVELALRGRRPVLLLLAAAVGALQLLAGHPQAAAYGFLAVQAFAVWRARSLGLGWKWAVAGAIGVPVGAACLAAAQLVPTAELVRLSVRSQGLSWDRFVSMSLPPERLLTFLLPNAFGNSADGTYWGDSAGFFIQLCGYAGILPLLFALNAVHRSRVPAVEFFGILTLSGLVLALGRYTDIFAVLYRLPGISFFRIPARFLLWSAFGISVLCGLGFDELLKRRPGDARRGWWWAGGCMLAVIAGMLWVNRELLQAAAGRAAAPGFDARMFVSQLWRDALRASVLIGVGCWMLSRRTVPGGGSVVRLGVPVLIFADLFSFGYGFNGLVDVAVYRDMPATARVIVKDTGPYPLPAPRVLSLIGERNSDLNWHSGWRRDASGYVAYPATLRMYSAGLYGLQNALPGWSPLHLRRHWEFMRGYPRFAALAGVGYVLRPAGCPSGRYVRIGSTWPAVCRNTAALPRAYVAGGYVVLPDGRQRLRYMMSSAFDPRREVVLEQQPPAGTGGHGGGARIVRYESRRVEIALDDCRGGFLVLSDTFYPGWRAWVDGVRAPVLRANHVFRAVPVPAGTRRVRFQMDSRSLDIGLWLSALSWLLWGGGAIWLARRSGGVGVPSCGRRLGMGPWALQIALILLVHGVVTQWPLWSGYLERCVAPGAWGGG